MINLRQYWMGRDVTHAADLTPEIQANARDTVSRANLLLLDFEAANPGAAPRTVNSGWRPPSVNAGVPGAAVRSKHLTAQAVDLRDDDGELDRWLTTATGLNALIEHDLYAEHADATPRWCHLQTVAPRSGSRIFRP